MAKCIVDVERLRVIVMQYIEHATIDYRKRTYRTGKKALAMQYLHPEERWLRIAINKARLKNYRYEERILLGLSIREYAACRIAAAFNVRVMEIIRAYVP